MALFLYDIPAHLEMWLYRYIVSQICPGRFSAHFVCGHISVDCYDTNYRCLTSTLRFESKSSTEHDTKVMKLIHHTSVRVSKIQGIFLPPKSHS